MRRFARWALADIRSGANTDLWVLVAAAMAFTMLGSFGVANTAALSSVVLALLALLAISQLRGRKELMDILALRRQGDLSILGTGFPARYYEDRRRMTHSYLFAGMTMGRTLATGRPEFETLLGRSGHIRIILPNPHNEKLMDMISEGYRHRDGADRIRGNIELTLTTLGVMMDHFPGQVKIRLTEVLPRTGINGMDMELPTGSLMIQHYEFRPPTEAAPILYLTPADEPWYSHFRAEAERIWESSQSWDP